MGYSSGAWKQLADDLREQHLANDVIETTNTPWGDRYVIAAPLTGPTGDTIMMRSIWQIDAGTVLPRLITMYPE